MKKFESKGKVKTVLGLIHNNQLGFTLPHEHFFGRWKTWFSEPEPCKPREKELVHQPVSLKNLSWIRSHRHSNLDNLSLTDVQMAIDEAILFKEAGGMTIVDVTPKFVGRDPAALVRIAQAADINVIMGTAYYIEASYSSEMRVGSKNDKNIADEFVRDITMGADNTGICAGIIGELGCSWPLTDNERKVLRAAAMAQQQTGAAITVHTPVDSHDEAALAIIKVLKESGADITRVIIGHIELAMHSHSARCRLLETGCSIEWDRFGSDGQYPIIGSRNKSSLDNIPDIPNDTERLNQIIRLVNEGYLDQILISQDVFTKIDLTHFGGGGYGHILNNIIPLMRDKGMTEEHINAITVQNPKRILTLN